MPTLRFEGDWSAADAEAIAATLKKSLGVSDLDEAGLQVPQLSGDPIKKRHKDLLELWKEAGGHLDDEVDDGLSDWAEYRLEKAIAPIPPGEGAILTAAGVSFPVTDGEFGPGIYFPIAAPSGALRVRCRIELGRSQLIKAADFVEMDEDFAASPRQIDGVVGDRFIMVRNPGDIELLGVVSGAHTLPQSASYQVVSFTPNETFAIADIELLPALTKSLQSNSYLDGTPLVKGKRSPVDRALLRSAVERIKVDGIDLSNIEIKLSPGLPDFLPSAAHIFCLPSDGVIHVAPHSPHEAIAALVSSLARRLRPAVEAGAVPPDEAISILDIAANLSPDWWLEMGIKRLVGAIHCDRAFGVLTGGSPPPQYLTLICARGFEFWGNRKAIAECMAEDFRCAHDPAGLPNLVTLEYDLAVPAIARMCQQVLLTAIAPVQ